jgi:hypothetical protein
MSKGRKFAQSGHPDSGPSRYLYSGVLTINRLDVDTDLGLGRLARRLGKADAHRLGLVLGGHLWPESHT